MSLKVIAALLTFAGALLALFGSTTHPNETHPWKRLTAFGRWTFLVVVIALGLQLFQMYIDGQQDIVREAVADVRADKPLGDILAVRKDLKNLAPKIQESLEASRRVEQALIRSGSVPPATPAGSPRPE